MQNDLFRKVSLIFSLLLALIFGAFALSSAGLGSYVYKGIIESSENNFNRRTAGMYIVQMLRRADERGAVAITSINGSDALMLTTGYENERYTTYIYVYQGKLVEVSVPEGEDASQAEPGEIVKAESLELSLEGRLIRITVKSGNEENEFCFFLNCGGKDLRN